MNTKFKYLIGTTAAVAAIGLGVHQGLSQTNWQSNWPPMGPRVVGPGLAPNVGQPPDPSSLSYYGNYYEDYFLPRTNPYNVSFGPNDIPRTSDSITTKLVSGNRVSFQWQGEPRAVRNITFALLDKNNATVSKQVITNLPASATLTKTAKTTGYSVTITYINGTSNTIVSPL